MDKRIGFIGIIVTDRHKNGPRVNCLLSECAEMILARMGLPRQEGDVSVITLVVEATSDEVGSLTGRLGQIPGVSVKSGLSKR